MPNYWTSFILLFRTSEHIWIDKRGNLFLGMEPKEVTACFYINRAYFGCQYLGEL